jgi:hypothetical protein
LALAGPQNPGEIDVTIAAPATGGPVAYYQVQWSTDPNFPPSPGQSPQLPATSTFYEILNLAAGTTYDIRIVAGNAAGQSPYSNVVAASPASPPVTTTTLPTTTTTAPGVTTTVPVTTTTTVPATTTTTQACALGAFTITTTTTGKTYLTKKGAMAENIGLNLSISNLCSWAVSVTSVLRGTSTLDPNAPYALTGPQSGGQWSATIPSSGQTNWSVGVHDMTVQLSGSATSVARGLLICAWKAPGQRSSTATSC